MKQEQEQENEGQVVLVGHIGVDSGLVMIGDPCYASTDHTKNPHPIHDWDRFCGSLHQGQSMEPTMKSLNFAHGVEGLGVVVSTAHGDGIYPVWAIVKDGMVMSIQVDFDPLNLDEDEDEEVEAVIEDEKEPLWSYK